MEGPAIGLCWYPSLMLELCHFQLLLFFSAAIVRSEIATALLTSATAAVAYQQLQLDVHLGLQVQVPQLHELEAAEPVGGI